MCQMRTVGWLASKPSYYLKDLFTTIAYLPYSVQLSISQRRYLFIQLLYPTAFSAAAVAGVLMIWTEGIDFQPRLTLPFLSGRKL